MSELVNHLGWRWLVVDEAPLLGVRTQMRDNSVLKFAYLTCQVRQPLRRVQTVLIL